MLSPRLSSFSCSMTSFFAMIAKISASNNCVIPTKQLACGFPSEQITYPYRLWQRPQTVPYPFQGPTHGRQVHRPRIRQPHYHCRAPAYQSTGYRFLARCQSVPFAGRLQRGLAACPNYSNLEFVGECLVGADMVRGADPDRRERRKARTNVGECRRLRRWRRWRRWWPRWWEPLMEGETRKI